MRLALFKEGRSSMREQITQQPRISQPIRKRASLLAPPPTADGTENFPARPINTEPLITHNRPHFLVFVGFGMLCFLALYILWNGFVIPWWQGVEDQWQYGQGRITRFEADVGHGGTSTFLAFVMSRQVIIIEAPNASMEHAKYYKTGPIMASFSTPPVIS